MGVWSDHGAYSITDSLIFSVPVVCDGGGKYHVYKGLPDWLTGCDWPCTYKGPFCSTINQHQPDIYDQPSFLKPTCLPADCALKSPFVTGFIEWICSTLHQRNVEHSRYSSSIPWEISMQCFQMMFLLSCHLQVFRSHDRSKHGSFSSHLTPTFVRTFPFIPWCVLLRSRLKIPK